MAKKKSHTSGEKPRSAKGELRRRLRAFLEAGAVAALRSEGRLAAFYVSQNADWATCEISFSVRHAARQACVHATTVRRGISQMVAAGILEVLDKGGGGKRARYRVGSCTQPVSTPGTSGAQPCTQPVSTPGTSGAQDVHDPCARWTHPVYKMRTHCAHDSVFFSGSPVRTSEDTSEATAGGGLGAATAEQEPLGSSPAAAAPLARLDRLTEEKKA